MIYYTHLRLLAGRLRYIAGYLRYIAGLAVVVLSLFVCVPTPTRGIRDMYYNIGLNLNLPLPPWIVDHVYKVSFTLSYTTLIM
jgi:hypothetical protein